MDEIRFHAGDRVRHARYGIVIVTRDVAPHRPVFFRCEDNIEDQALPECFQDENPAPSTRNLWEERGAR